MAITSNNSGTNIWFGISMALGGVIIGYVLAMATGTAALPAATDTGGGNQPTAAKPDPSPSPSKPPSQEAQDVKPVDPQQDHIRGDPGATISVIEYSDYECPFCKRHHPTMQRVVEEIDDVNWVYRHFPLGMHPTAKPAAIASECVAELGGNDAFWEFTDIVFERGSQESKFADYAQEAGVNADSFQQCVDSDKYAQEVDQEMQSGRQAGVRGTPGNIVLNNETGESRLISGAQPFSRIKSAIEELRE